MTLGFLCCMVVLHLRRSCAESIRKSADVRARIISIGGVICAKNVKNKLFFAEITIIQLVFKNAGSGGRTRVDKNAIRQNHTQTNAIF